MLLWISDNPPSNVSHHPSNRGGIKQICCIHEPLRPDLHRQRQIKLRAQASVQGSYGHSSSLPIGAFCKHEHHLEQGLWLRFRSGWLPPVSQKVHPGGHRHLRQPAATGSSCWKVGSRQRECSTRVLTKNPIRDSVSLVRLAMGDPTTILPGCSASKSTRPPRES